MAIINVTPVMTSNTSPSPYVASSSSQYSSAYDAYIAFDGKESYSSSEYNCWATKDGETTGWLKIDLATQVGVDIVSIKSRNHTSSNHAGIPKSVKILASKDDVSYVELYSENNINWKKDEERNFELQNNSKYRFYKFEFVAQDGYTVVCISSIKLFSILENVSHKNASLTYTLPMATTEKIKAKSKDKRVGLLGMANDDENFGDLYVVGKDGKSHLTKSGIKSEILFEGNAKDVTEYTLTKSMNDYKFLMFISDCELNGVDIAKHSQLVIVDDIVMRQDSVATHWLSGYTSSGAGYRIGYNFRNDKTFYVTKAEVSQSSWSNPKITKIIGIY